MHHRNCPLLTFAGKTQRLGNVNGSMLSESVVEMTDGGTASETAFKRYPESTGGNQADGTDEDEVDEVVIDNDFWVEGGGSKTLTAPSDRGAATPDVSGTHGGTHMTDHDSLHEEGVSKLLTPLRSSWWRIRTAFMQFFFTCFYDQAAEAQYRKETYFQSKALAIWGSCFVVLNWVRRRTFCWNSHATAYPADVQHLKKILVCVLASRENEIFWDKMFYYAV